MTDHEHTPPTEAEQQLRFMERDLATIEDRHRSDADGIDEVDTLVDIPRLLEIGHEAIDEVRRLRAERSADSERLDWLETHDELVSVTCHHRSDRLPGWAWRRRANAFWRSTTNTRLREAIDAARQEPTP